MLLQTAPVSSSTTTQPAWMSEEVPESVRAGIAAFRAILDAYAAFENRITEIHALECAAGKEDGVCMVTNTECYHAKDEIKESADRLRRRITRIAEKQFAPYGAALKIDSCDIERFPTRDPETFDGLAMWQFLAQKYRKTGATQAYRDMARALNSAFGLRDLKETKMVSGRMVLECRVWGDSILGTHLGYSAVERICNVMAGFRAVGGWAELWGEREAHDVRKVIAAAHEAEKIHGAAPSRMAIADSILIVPYKSKWEFRLSPLFAEKVQLFWQEFRQE